jgi:hypothetical protein
MYKYQSFIIALQSARAALKQKDGRIQRNGLIVNTIRCDAAGPWPRRAGIFSGLSRAALPGSHRSNPNVH